MRPAHELVTDYVGFSGWVDFIAESSDVDTQTVRIGAVNLREPKVARGVVQRFNPNIDRVIRSLPEPSPDERLLLSGVLSQPASWHHFTVQLISALKNGDLRYLSRVDGEFAVCVLVASRVFLFRSLTANDNIYYRRDGPLLNWATDPSEIVDKGGLGISGVAIRRCCQGHDEFVYRDVKVVPRGCVVSLDRLSTSSYQFQDYPKVDLPKRPRLAEYAALTRGLLVRSTRRIARSGRIGVLLSGGIDSSTVLAALAENGADLIAYHWDTDDKIANEAAYAVDVCNHHSIRLIRIPARVQDDYLPLGRRFPLPYNHGAYQWYEQVAEHAERDGVNILTTGRGADENFGINVFRPHDILFGDITWRERFAQFAGVLTTNKYTPDLLKSIWRPQRMSEIGVAGATIDTQIYFLRRADFLRPTTCEAPIPRLEGFSPQSDALELTVWRPRGISICHPHLDKDLVGLSRRLPNAYKRIHFRGRTIQKPVLRLAFAGMLPETVLRRTWRSWQDAMTQKFCIQNASMIRSLLVGKNSRLLEEDLISPDLLQTVLSSRRLIRHNADSLVCTAMTEIFLRGL